MQEDLWRDQAPQWISMQATPRPRTPPSPRPRTPPSPRPRTPPSPCPPNPPTPRPPTPPSSSPPLDPPSDFDQEVPGNSSGRNPPAADGYPPTIHRKIQTSIDFIQMVEESTLESQFEPEELADLLDPREHKSTPSDNPALKLSLRNFISLMGSSQAAYEAVRQNVCDSYPDIALLLYYQAERRARELSGVITWEHHMCVKSCAGFTGPFFDLEHCPKCGEPWYKEKDLEDSDGEQKVP